MWDTCNLSFQNHHYAIFNVSRNAYSQFYCGALGPVDSPQSHFVAFLVLGLPCDVLRLLKDLGAYSKCFD